MWERNWVGKVGGNFIVFPLWCLNFKPDEWIVVLVLKKKRKKLKYGF